MLTADDGRAAEIAAELERANRERREVELEVLAGAERARAELPEELADAPGWCSPARTGMRGWWASSPRGSSSATSGPSF